MSEKDKEPKPRTRVVSIAVARPLTMEKEQWKEMLKSLWVESTSLANWALLEWVKAEPVRLPTDEKMGKLPTIYHYGEMVKKYESVAKWSGAKASANCILQAVRKKWLKDRYAVCWQRRQAPPLFRYPYPYRVHAKSWQLAFDDNGQPHIWVTFPGGRVELLLRSGQEYRRQIKQLKLIVDGKAKGLELLIDKNTKTGQVIVRVVAKFAPVEETGKPGVLSVSTSPTRFFVANSSNGGQEWLLNGDHVKRWIVSHAEFLQRISEDTKFEKRWPHKMRRHINEHREVRCRKQHDRLRSWINESCAVTVGLALRRKCGTLEYDDGVQSYLPSFPWFELRERMRVKCQDMGIVFQHHPSPVVVEESEETVSRLEEV